MYLGQFLPIFLLFLRYLSPDLIVTSIDHLLQCMDATGPVCAVFAHSERLHDVQEAMVCHLGVQLYNADEVSVNLCALHQCVSLFRLRDSGVGVRNNSYEQVEEINVGDYDRNNKVCPNKPARSVVNVLEITQAEQELVKNCVKNRVTNRCGNKPCVAAVFFLLGNDMG